MKKMLSLIVLTATLAVLLVGCGKKTEAAWQEQYDLGVRYMEDGDYEEAILAFTAAIEIDPKRADAYTSLAEIYMELGEYGEAVDILEQALSNLDGGDRDVLEELEELLDEAERMDSIDFEHLVEDAFRQTIQDADNPYMEPSEWVVPKIMLDGREIDAINDEIWDTLFEGGIQAALDESAEGYSVGRGITYRWAVNGDILSIWIEAHPAPHAWTDYYIYNISIRRGEKVRDREVYSAAGFSSSQFRQRVRQAAGSRFWEPFLGQDMQSFIYQEAEMFNAQLQSTISEENVQLAMPFLNEQGHLCIAIPIYSMAGAGCYWQEIDLEDFTPVPDYDQGVGAGAAPARGVTEEQAYEIVRNYWNFVPGTIVDDTGYELFLNSFGSMTGSNGRTYYEIRLQWLVDGETEWGHLSTIDVMYVDAITGELVGDMLP